MELKKQEKQTNAIKFEAVESGKVIGRAYLYLIHNDLHSKPYGLLEDVFVEEEYRGQGIGTKLIQAVIKEAKEKGCYKLIGTSRHFRPKVHEMYEKLGFKNYGVEFRINL